MSRKTKLHHYEQTTFPMTIAQALFYKFKQFLCLTLSIALTFNPLLINVANAAPQNDIAVDANANAAYQAHLKSSANGTDVVDITAPTSSGTSVNHWERLNNTQGMIFNNSQYDGNSRIGGFVDANINMNQPGSSAASVILNQVNGTSRSHFTNTTEIFGTQAKFIISNPNGVTCNGCGFIGAPKVTLTTGNPTYNSPGGDWSGDLSVNGGDVEIGNNGFRGFVNDGDPANDVSYVDIIARSVNIIGELSSTSEVNIITGRNDYNYNTGNTNKKAYDGSAKPEIAIDTSVLGSISSGRIRLIANEDGVGVKSEANVTSSADDIIISSNGKATIRNLNSASDILITSTNDDVDAGDITSTRDTNITANNSIFINDNITTGQDLFLTTINNNIQVADNSTIQSSRDIFLDADNNIYNLGILKADYNIDIAAKGNNTDSNLTDEKGLINTGKLEANNNLIIHDTYNLINKDNGQILANLGDVNIALTNDLINKNNGIIKANNLVQITANNLYNQDSATIESSNSANFYITNLLENQAIIKTTNDLTIKKDQLSEDNIGELKNSGTLNVQNDLKINADNINMFSQAIATTRDIFIKAVNYVNDTLIQAGRNLVMTLTGTFTNNSTSRLHADNHLHVTANVMNNYGVIDSGSNLRIKTLDNNLNTNGLYNKGLIYSGGDLSLYATNNILNQNSIYSVGNMYLGDKEIDKKFLTDLDSGADIGGVVNLALTNNVTNNSTGTIESEGDINVELANILRNEGVYVAPTLYQYTIRTWGGRFPGAEYAVRVQKGNSLQSSIKGNNINIVADSVQNYASYIGAVNDINITANTLENRNLFTSPVYNWIGGYNRHGYTSFRTWNGTENSGDIPLIHAGNQITLTLNGQTVTTDSANNPVLASLINNGNIFGGQGVSISSANTVLNQGLGVVLLKEVIINLDQFLPKVDGVVTRVNVNDTADAIDPSYKFYLVSTLYDFDPAKYQAQSRIINQIRKVTGDQNAAQIRDCINNGNTADYCISLVSITEDANKQFILQTDPKTENDIIQKAAVAMTGKAHFSESAKTDEEDRNALYNNALEFTIANAEDGLEFGKALSDDQQAKLTKTILWYVEEEKDGIIMLVAKVYMPKSALDNQPKGSGGEINGGSGNLSVIANSGDIINEGGKLSGYDIILEANNGNILSKSNKSSDVVGGNIKEFINSEGSIKATNDLTLTAGNETRIIGALISAGGDTNITTEDLIVEALAVRNRNEFISKKYTSITDETKNTGSEIVTGGSLIINASNDALIKGSDITVTGNANINTVGDLAIVSAQDTSYKFTASKKKGSFGRGSSSSSTTNKTTQVSSNINVGGDINSTSKKNITILASNLISASGDVNLTAKEQINILSGQDTYSKETTSTKNGLTTTAKTQNINETVTQVISDINAANGSITTKSGSDTNIIASNLVAGNDATLKVGSYIDSANNEIINNDATLNILNAKDSEYSYESSSKLSKMDVKAIAVGFVGGALTGGATALTGAYA
ncbi:hemagglutinin repeat-containing protein, partial [Rickettsiales bacterium]|nr:hemagglutinin repeat-containing protein [Rickettsiales bacterium]